MLRFTLAIAIAPALLLLWLFKKWDEKRPEPPGAVRNVVIFGMITCLPAAGIELGMTALLGKDVVEAQGQFLNAFLIAAFTEEAVKLAVVLLYLWRKPHFDEVMDGILYTAAASLGFALLENVLYSAGNPATGLVRAFTAVPLHAVCSGIMGYFVGRGKLAKSGTAGWILAGFAAAVFIHGLYDWIVFSGAGFGVFEPEPLLSLGAIVVLVAICGVILRLLVKNALAHDDVHLGTAPRPLEPQPTAAAAYAAPGYGASAYGAPAAPAYGQAPHAQPYGQAPQPYAQQYPQQQYPQQHAQQYPQQAYAQPGAPPHPQPQHPQQHQAPQPYAQPPAQPYGAPQPTAPGWAPGAPYGAPQTPATSPQPGYAAPAQPPGAAVPGPPGPWDPRGGGGYGT